MAQKDLSDKVYEILSKMKEYEGRPAAKAGLLTDPETQRVLHAYGDSFAHVNDKGQHYDPVIGHGLKGESPDNPDEHPLAYSSYVSDLYKIAANAAGSSSRVDTSALSAAVSAQKVESAQKAVLAAAAKAAGGSGLVDSPVAGCELGERCQPNRADGVINGMYEIWPPAIPNIDWTKFPVKF